MSQPVSQEITLKVAEAIQDDVNKGIVRVDTNFMRDAGVRPGDIVELQGSRKTVAIVDRAYPGDIGLNIIRMDGIIRHNAKTAIGEEIVVRKADVKEAKRVVVSPARQGIVIKASPSVFKQGLLGRAVMKGDIVSLGGTRRRRSTMSSSPYFDEVFSMIDENLMNFGFGDLKFVVASSTPKQAVIITENTEVIFNPEAVEVKDEQMPEVMYEDIGGLGEEITKIREMVELPLKHPEIFERLGIDPPKGVLLHGPPGTGKTLLAKAVANETNSHFISINGPEVMSKYYGQSEENLRKKFEEAEKNAPSIVFIDELDAIAAKREETRGEVERRVVAQLLTVMDGLKSRGRVVVIAATNVPNILDPALRRPGRFDREIEIGVPRYEGRLNILKIHTRNMPIKGTFYPDIAAQELLSTIDDALDQRNHDLETLDRELKRLQSQQEKAESSLVQTILSKIKRVESRLTTTRERLSQTEAVKNQLEQNKSILNQLIPEIQNIEGSDEIWKASDPRAEFVKLARDKVEPALLAVSEALITSGVLNRDYYNRVRNRGVSRDLGKIASMTHGFVGADLAALSKESAMVLLRRMLPDLKYDSDEAIPPDVLEKLTITITDFIEALKTVRPSAMREVLVEVPNVSWNHVGGLDSVKQELREAVEWPLKNPEAFKRLGVTPPKGILMYGPPGTGKTLLAKAVANESESNFILVNGPSLLSKWVGESEKAVRKIFEKARQTSPTIIFFDEIDSLAPHRGMSNDSNVMERVVNQLLSELDGLESLHDVVIIGATNRPDMVDSALLRPGRFDRIVMVGSPEKDARKHIFEVHTKTMPLAADIDLDTLAEKTEGYVGADIEAVCREAAILALRRDIASKEVTLADFDKALEKVRASVTPEILQRYEELQGHFTQQRAREMGKTQPNYFG